MKKEDKQEKEKKNPKRKYKGQDRNVEDKEEWKKQVRWRWTENWRKRQGRGDENDQVSKLIGLVQLLVVAVMLMLLLLMMIVKGKAIPLQVWTGLEGSRRLTLPDFKTISTW